MKYTKILCDECHTILNQSNNEIDYFEFTYQFDNGNNDFWKGWTRKDLCGNCLNEFKLNNPTIKVRKYIENK